MRRKNTVPFKFLTTDGLKKNLEKINGLIIKIGKIPCNYLGSDDVKCICNFLSELEKSLSHQIDNRRLDNLEKINKQ